MDPSYCRFCGCEMQEGEDEHPECSNAFCPTRNEQSCPKGRTMTTPLIRVRKFARVWDQLKKVPDIYGLETGHPERECALTTTDLHDVLNELEAWRFRFPDLAYTNKVDGIQPKADAH